MGITPISTLTVAVETYFEIHAYCKKQINRGSKCIWIEVNYILKQCFYEKDISSLYQKYLTFASCRFEPQGKEEFMAKEKTTKDTNETMHENSKVHENKTLDGNLAEKSLQHANEPLRSMQKQYPNDFVQEAPR